MNKGSIVFRYTEKIDADVDQVIAMFTLRIPSAFANDLLKHEMLLSSILKQFKISNVKIRCAHLFSPQNNACDGCLSGELSYCELNYVIYFKFELKKMILFLNFITKHLEFNSDIYLRFAKRKENILPTYFSNNKGGEMNKKLKIFLKSQKLNFGQISHIEYLISKYDMMSDTEITISSKLDNYDFLADLKPKKVSVFCDIMYKWEVL